MRDWIARLGDAGLAGSCGAEDPPRHPMWFHIAHLYSHAIQQFADAATLLTRPVSRPVSSTSWTSSRSDSTAGADGGS